MNYMGKSGSNRNYKPKHNMQRDFYRRPSPERDLRFLEPMPRPKATPQPENINRFERDRQRALDDILQNRKKENQMGPMSAGVDFGNRRPMYDRNGKLIQQRPVLKDTSTVPVPIMDYVGSRTAMNKGMDNWGGYLGGTFDQEGYGDPSSKNPWGGYQEPEYSYDTYDDDVLDPGLDGFHALGPLYFG